MFSSSDMWGLGCLVWESFNGPLRNRSNLKDIENVSGNHLFVTQNINQLLHSKFITIAVLFTGSKVIDKFVL